MMPIYKKGISLLLLVIVVGGVSFLMVSQSLWRGIYELDASQSFEEGRKAFFVAQSCLEESLRRLRISAAYTGGTGVSVPGGSCTITVIGGGASRTITVVGSVTQNDFTQSIIASVTIGSDVITMNSWQMQE